MRWIWLICAFFYCPLAAAEALTTVFTYQGELIESSLPANGIFDFQFELHEEEEVNALVGPVLIIEDVAVDDGIFSVELDFGDGPIGNLQLWLEIAVRDGASSGGFQGLAPRQKLTAAPYTLFARDVRNGSIASAQVANNSLRAVDLAADSVGESEILESEVQRRVSGVCPSGSYVRWISETGSVGCGSPSRGIAKAAGSVRFDGVLGVGSFGVDSVNWNPSLDRYEIDLTDTYYSIDDISMVTITGDSGSCPGGAGARQTSVGGLLLVYIVDGAGSEIQCSFRFVTFLGQ